jgi:hypothetical protein
VDSILEAFNKLEKPVGFMSYKNISEEVVYLAGVVVDKNYQHRGIYNSFMRKMMNEMKNDVKYVVARTQNPIIYYVTRKYVKSIYPNNSKIPRQIYEIALLIDKRVNEDLIIKQCYGRRLSSEVKKSKDDEINKLFGKLNLDKGDAFLIIGQLN